MRFVCTSIVRLVIESAIDHGSGLGCAREIAKSGCEEGLIGIKPGALLGLDFRFYKVELFLTNHYTWMDEILGGSSLERKWSIACDGGTNN